MASQPSAPPPIRVAAKRQDNAPGSPLSSGSPLIRAEPGSVDLVTTLRDVEKDLLRLVDAHGVGTSRLPDMDASTRASLIEAYTNVRSAIERVVKIRTSVADRREEETQAHEPEDSEGAEVSADDLQQDEVITESAVAAEVPASGTDESSLVTDATTSGSMPEEVLGTDALVATDGVQDNGDLPIADDPGIGAGDSTKEQAGTILALDLPFVGAAPEPPCLKETIHLLTATLLSAIIAADVEIEVENVNLDWGAPGIPFAEELVWAVDWSLPGVPFGEELVWDHDWSLPGVPYDTYECQFDWSGGDIPHFDASFDWCFDDLPFPEAAAALPKRTFKDALMHNL